MPIPTTFQAKPQAAEAPPAPATPAVPTMQGPTLTPISVLEEQVATFAQQLAGLKAQRSVLQRQISNSNDATTRASLELRRVPLDKQIQQTEMDLASARAQLQSRQGQTTMPAPDFPPSARRGMDPDLVAGMMFAFIFAVLMPMSIAMARRIWRGKRDITPRTEDTVSPRLDRLEQAIDAIAIEVERVSEGQRFVTKVLTERPQPVTRPATAPESENAVGLGEAKPFLALGAGPIEPIRVAERQAVRQSNTPH